MNKLYLSVFFLLLTTGLLPAQNLVPNPGFEAFTICPTTFGQVVRCTGYDQPSAGTSDYWNCGAYGNAMAIIGTPNTGTGVMAMWSGPNRPSCPGSAEAEMIRASLVSNLTPTQTYDVTINLMVDTIGGGGSFTDNPNNCTDYGVLFYENSSPPSFPDQCCIPDVPQVLILGQTVLKGTYTSFSGSFVAGAAFDRIVFGTFCNANTASCSEANKVYFNLDDVSVVLGTTLDAEIYNFSVSSKNASNLLNWQMDYDVDDFSSLVIQRRITENQFQNIAHFDPTDSNLKIGSYEDNTFTSLDNWYRIQITQKNGSHLNSDLKYIRRSNFPISSLEIYSMPEDGLFQLNYISRQSQSATLKILSLDGKEIRRKTIWLNAGQNQIVQSLSVLPKGIYITHIIERDGRSAVSKLIRN